MRTIISLFLFILTSISAFAEGPAWWDAKWPLRKHITLDTSAKGSVITDAIGTAPLLIRLHDGNFSFLSAKEDGSDLRIVANDQKTLLKHHIEKWDSLLNEAYVWVQVPDVKPSAVTSLWLYYGNVTDAVNTGDSKITYDDDTLSVYHFGDTASAAKDSASSSPCCCSWLSMESSSCFRAVVAQRKSRILGLWAEFHFSFASKEANDEEMAA